MSRPRTCHTHVSQQSLQSKNPPPAPCTGKTTRGMRLNRCLVLFLGQNAAPPRPTIRQACIGIRRPLTALREPLGSRYGAGRYSNIHSTAISRGDVLGIALHGDRGAQPCAPPLLFAGLGNSCRVARPVCKRKRHSLPLSISLLSAFRNAPGQTSRSFLRTALCHLFLVVPPSSSCVVAPQNGADEAAGNKILNPRNGDPAPPPPPPAFCPNQTPGASKTGINDATPITLRSTPPARPPPPRRRDPSSLGGEETRKNRKPGGQDATTRSRRQADAAGG